MFGFSVGGSPKSKDDRILGYIVGRHTMETSMSMLRFRGFERGAVEGFRGMTGIRSTLNPRP